MNKNFVYLLFISLIFMSSTWEEGGYEIKIKIKGFEQKETYLGYHFGDKQYIKDTVQIGADGYFTFKGEEALEGGVYLLIMPPENQYFQLLINPGDQRFTVETDIKDVFENMKISGSKDNQLFYEYTTFLSKQKPEAEKLKKELEEAGEDKAKAENIQKKLDKLNDNVKNYQEDLVKKDPTTITAAIIKSSFEVPIPEYQGTEDEVQLKRYLYYKKHYFDHLDMGDSRMLRSPMLFNRINYYMEKLTPQHPDSLIVSIDRVLDLVSPSEETFKFYVIHFLNEYAKSKFVGMDAVYVYIGEKYYCNGKAWWVEAEQLDKICSNVAKLKPILLGKTAPDIEMQRQDGSKLALHEVKSDFTVLFFWDPECGHCKKSLPDVKAFYEKYKTRGVEIFGVCTKLGEDSKSCWDGVKEHEMPWINVIDPFMRSKFKTLYDIRSTPKIFVLDKDKKIISKGIGGEQLEEVLEHEIIKLEQQQLGLKENN